MTVTPTALWVDPAADDAERTARSLIDRFARHWQQLPRSPGALCPSLADFLDRVDPVIQPRVALLDVDLDRRRMPIRLYATSREHGFGQNLTGTNALEAYPERLRPHVWTVAQHVVGQPCGYLTVRIMTSARGMSMRLISLSLPIETPTLALKGLANCTEPVGPVPDEAEPARVNSIDRGWWVNIGAGIPGIPAA